MTDQPNLETIKINTSINLDPCPIFPREAVHIFDRQQVIALLAALNINRPLLVRGEPGCGKTQMARAAAEVLKMPLASLVVNERTETEDLFYRYDALRRLSDANDPNKSIDEEEEYLSAGPLWWAFDHATAKNYNKRFSTEPYLGKKNERLYDNRVLLLIDEIDKADRSVPNSLLEALGNYSFRVPYKNTQIECKKGKEPLIIITTNEEQELPPAFVRRCLVLTLTFPKSVEELAKRGEAFLERVKEKYKFSDKIDDVAKKAAAMVWEKRKKAEGSPFLPGQAEYFDHLEAIVAMRVLEPEKSLDTVMTELAGLTYNKSARP